MRTLGTFEHGGIPLEKGVLRKDIYATKRGVFFEEEDEEFGNAREHQE